MLIDRDVKGAEEYVILAWIIPAQLCLTIRVSYTKQMISDLLQNKVDMSQLVITKALAKTGRHEII
jgi:DNA polymerase delta subunit 1